LKEYNVKHYSTENENKGAVIERFNRTLKMKLTKLFDIRQTFKYIDVLQNVIKNYNNTYHRTINMTPNEASQSKNEQEIFSRVFPNQELEQTEKPKYKVGDLVRIPIKKSAFSKEGTGNFTIEIFKIKKIKNTTPITYELEDLQNEEIKGSFYEPELVLVPPKVMNEAFRIEKIIETKGKGKNKQALVKYLGWPDKFNEWLPFDNVKNSVT